MSVPPSSGVREERPLPGVALLRLAGGPPFNTLDVGTLEALGTAVEGLVRDAELAAIVLTGEGGEAFAAGADLREVSRLSPREALAFAAFGQRVFGAIERAPQYVIGAIDGYCMGGGLDLALGCDARHASPRSTFAHPGARLGILTGFGGTARLARAVGRARAVELFATARRFGGEEAARMGLVDVLDPDPVASALAAARAIAGRGPAEVAALKREALAGWRGGPARAWFG
jgi:enoyl-CoA hydratase